MNTSDQSTKRTNIAGAKMHNLYTGSAIERHELFLMVLTFLGGLSLFYVAWMILGLVSPAMPSHLKVLSGFLITSLSLLGFGFTVSGLIFIIISLKEKYGLRFYRVLKKRD